MERKTSILIPDAILTADWHLRETLPPCRTDDFFAEQWRKVDWISELQKKYDCPVLHAGDLFDFWKPSPELLSLTIQHLPEKFFTIYGNHDLPQHSLELAYKSGVYTLEKAGALFILNAIHWGQEHNNDISFKLQGSQRNIVLWHIMTFQGKKPFPGCKDMMSAGLLRKYPDYDLILTGHNHQTFVEEHEGRLLVNPGCITRQESDQDNHTPKVFLYFADTNTVKSVEIPHSKDVVIKPANIQKIEERNERIEAFISKLNADWDGDINFEKNLEIALEANTVEPEVKKIIYKAIEE